MIRAEVRLPPSGVLFSVTDDEPYKHSSGQNEWLFPKKMWIVYKKTSNKDVWKAKKKKKKTFLKNYNVNKCAMGTDIFMTIANIVNYL